MIKVILTNQINSNVQLNRLIEFIYKHHISVKIYKNSQIIAIQTIETSYTI